MPLTYTQSGGITKIGTGEQSGNWGNIANTDFDIIDRLTNGVGSIALAGTASNLTTTNGALSNGQYKVLVFTGTLASAHTVTIDPNTQPKFFFVVNSTNQNVIMAQGSGATVTVASGRSKIIYCNGAGATAAVFDISNTLAVGDGTFTGAITGATINNTPIGGTTPSTGAFTTVTADVVDTPSLTNNGAAIAINVVSAHQVTIGTTNTERMRVSSDGDVSVGTATARAGLHVYGAGTSNGSVNDAANRKSFLRVSDDATFANSGGGILFSNSQGDTANSAGMAAIKGVLVSGGGNTTGGIAFSTRTNTGDTLISEKMRLHPSGGLSVGSTTDPGASVVSAPYLSATSNSAVTLLGADHALQTGLTGGQNLAISNTTIQGRSNGVANTLNLNTLGGTINVGGSGLAQNININGSVAGDGVATLAQAQAGTNNTTIMTPLRTWQAVPLAVADIAAGGVGSYTFAYVSTATDYNRGDTVAGSSLRTCSAAWSITESNSAGATTSTNQSGLTGTWRCMGTYDDSFTRTTGPVADGATLWLRIS